MKKNFESAFSKVIKSEGGYVNNRHDKGGMTNHGCTAKVWAAFNKRDIATVTEDEMRKLTIDDVKPVYKKNYWDVVKGDDLTDGLDYSIFDCAVNSGPGRAAILLQKIVGVKPDGDIGKITLAAVKKYDTKELINKYNVSRVNFLKSLDDYKHFGKGWTARVDSVNDDANSMIA